MSISLFALLLCGTAVQPAAAQLPSVPFELVLDPSEGEAAFRAPLPGGAVFVTRAGELVYALASAGSSGWAVVERFDGAAARPVGLDEGETRVSRFLGDDPARWTCDAPTFARVDLGQLWPGIEVELEARAANVEKRFTVRPHGRPELIRVRVQGACELVVDDDGALVARTGAGEVSFTAPIAWQTRGGEREPVEVRYAVVGDAYGFELGAYDRERELSIDPLLQATYLGGSAWDEVESMQRDSASGALFVAGSTNSTNFPGTAGGAFPAASGSTDAFVAKLSSSLTTLQRATYYGGSSDDKGRGIAVGANGVYLCGSTLSASLPGTAGGADPTRNGPTDGFVARFDSNLATLLGATYLGGSEAFGDDFPEDIAVDAVDGTVVAVGVTDAPDLPLSALSSEPGNHGGQDAYATRINATLTSFVVSAFIGGSQNDYARSVVIQAGTGHIFIGGGTSSNDLLVQLGTGGGQGTLFACGFCDSGFVARLTPLMSLVEGASFIGGFDTCWVQDIAQAPDGTIYAVGTTSTALNSVAPFPGLGGSAQPQPGGGDDAFVARFSGDLQVVFNTSYVGGASEDWGYSVAVEPVSGEVFVGGHSNSWNLAATAGSYQSFPADSTIPGVASTDAFISRLTPALNQYVRSTYYGGTYGERALALVAAGSELYVAGWADSTNLPGTAGGAQPVALGYSNGFAARFDADLGGSGTTLPHVYCPSGTSFNGCQPTISASANPSASMATPCSITAADLEGQRLGIIFYSAMGRWGAPWCTSGGTSYLCIRIPTQRTSVQSSGGTALACDGAITLDWNAWHAANPAAIGNFLAVGSLIDLQCWYRDPGNCKNTSLSNAVEVRLLP